MVPFRVLHPAPQLLPFPSRSGSGKGQEDRGRMEQALGGFGWQSALPGKFMSSACSQGGLIVFLFLPFA